LTNTKSISRHMYYKVRSRLSRLLCFIK